MEHPSGTYEQVIALIDDVLPELARQIREEVARGKLVEGTRIAQSSMFRPLQSLSDSGARRVTEADRSTIPYSEDERLNLAIDGIVRVADTLQASLRVVAELARDADSASVTFTDPGEVSPDVIDLNTATGDATRAAEIVREVLRPYLTSVTD